MIYGRWAIMKKVFGYSLSGHFEFQIKTHDGIYYLYLDDKKLARCDEEKPLRTYIDGYVYCYELHHCKKKVSK